ncbi:hypothetical protein AGMMS50293_11930 [Spirochaetia bacterium]|nr:hypothetical protein AGMMS50293_11930 [Spirochaetia bacterium]
MYILYYMVFDWDPEKNSILKKTRNISFEEVVNAIVEGKLLDVIDNPHKEKYKEQIYLFVEISNYVYVVPAVISKTIFFLKTIYPSRKYTEKYLRGKNEEKHQG